MSDISTILSLPLIQPSQAQKHVTHNEALRLLDVAVQLAVTDRDRADPPLAPAPGDRHIVAAGGTGDWAGQDGTVAVYDSDGWRFVVPNTGWRAYVAAEAATVVFDGTNWATDVPATANLPMVGVNTTADANNRLSVASEASLFTHAGADHRMVMNKAGSAQTASLLFQSGWSGRAEIGTTGDDDFHVKVSPDGSTWHEAMQVSGATGGARVLGGFLIDDKLAFHRGNILGAVSQTAGVPGGAVIEAGSNANGSYTRFADGTQICRHGLRLNYANSGKLNETWIFPAGFIGTAHVAATFDINDLGANAAPDADEVTAPGVSAVGASSVVVQVRRIRGLTDFAPGDTVLVYLSATGRWF